MPDARRRRPRVDPARAAAYDVLVAVREDEAYANLALARVLGERGLTGRDAAFATELASGTIRRQGTYDAVLATCIDRPLARVDAGVLDALRLGAHQLLATRVPAHAAISTTVDLVRARVAQSAAGFANAVLRRVSAHDLDGWLRRVAPPDPLGFASVAHSHPRWVVESLDAALAAVPGEEELDALLAADNLPPRVTLVARPGVSSREELVAAGGVASPRSPYAVELPGGDPGAVPAVAEGRAGVQDEGSQLVALALAGAPLEESALGGSAAGGSAAGERWLDVCAGPGGKSALLAAIAAGRGARLLAAERQPHRAALVDRATARVRDGLSGVVVADGRRPAWSPASFDRVLVDAPCSGLGALRRRPEARWRRSPDDLADLVPLQEALLHSAVESVRAGGVVLYATCSPVLAETRDVVSTVLAARDDVRLEDAQAALDRVDGVHVDAATARGPLEGTVQLWPHRHGTDAMFMALLRRIA